ncbi:Conserved_hypothetical protein [Hexamita inflata]|uniref:Transmembrane protein n=2 Tax=Hexamita inflata TaxID=28002 RepID=A0AA86TNY9_9EUKA|nr:Conserved hypothetical protein [Hexamita inflata]CAI9950258.1 Conserved hypothetical protein [Hexamita inflata]
MILYYTIQQSVYISGYNNIYNPENYIDTTNRSFGPLTFCFGNFKQYDIPLNLNEISYTNQYMQIWANNNTYTCTQPNQCEVYTGPHKLFDDVVLYTIYQNVSVKSFSRDLFNQIVLTNTNKVFIYGQINDDITHIKLSDVLCANQLDISIIPKYEIISQVNTMQNVSYIITDKSIYFIGDCGSSFGICGYDNSNILVSGQVAQLQKFNLPANINEIKEISFHFKGIVLKDQNNVFYYAGVSPQYHCVNVASNTFLRSFEMILGQFISMSIGDVNAVLVSPSSQLYYCGKHIQNSVVSYYLQPTLLNFDGLISQACAMLTGVLVLNDTGLYAYGKNQFGSLGLGTKQIETNGFVLVNSSFGSNMKMVCHEDRVIIYQQYVDKKAERILLVEVTVIPIFSIIIIIGIVNICICSNNGKKLIQQRVKNLKQQILEKQQKMRDTKNQNKQQLERNIEQLLQQRSNVTTVQQQTQQNDINTITNGDTVLQSTQISVGSNYVSQSNSKVNSKTNSPQSYTDARKRKIKKKKYQSNVDELPEENE